MDTMLIISLLLLIGGLTLLVIGLIILWNLDVSDQFTRSVASSLLISAILLLIGAIISLSLYKQYKS